MEIIKVSDTCYICRVKVDRSRSNREAINVAGFIQSISPEVVDSAPRGEGETAEIIFFKPEQDEYTRPGSMSNEGWEKALVKRGLTAAPLDDVAAVNEADPAFADEVPHGTHWKNADGNRCCAMFDRWDDERDVDVRRSDYDWDDHWWFAGVRSASQN